MLQASDTQRLVDALEQRARTLEERANTLERENKILREELALLRQHIFGRRSERLEPGQMGLFGLDELAQAAVEAAQAQERARMPSAKPKGHGRAAFPDHLPRETVALTVPEG